MSWLLHITTKYYWARGRAGERASLNLPRLPSDRSRVSVHVMLEPLHIAQLLRRLMVRNLVWCAVLWGFWGNVFCFFSFFPPWNVMDTLLCSGPWRLAIIYTPVFNVCSAIRSPKWCTMATTGKTLSLSDRLSSIQTIYGTGDWSSYFQCQSRPMLLNQKLWCSQEDRLATVPTFPFAMRSSWMHPVKYVVI